MTRPAVPALADTLYDELGVSQPNDERLGWPFLIFLAGFATAFGRLPEFIRDTDDGPGWSLLLDPTRSPAWALPWLAQFAGVRLTPGLTDDQHRLEITSPSAFRRGTRDAMAEAMRRTLASETARVTIVERDGSPYGIRAISYEADTPDPGATEAAARSQKPAGYILAYETHIGWTYGEFAAAEATYADAAADFPTYGDLQANLP